MYALLILPVLISGFIVCNKNLKIYYKLHRYEGQFLYLKSAHLGFVCVAISALILAVLKAYIPQNLSIFSFHFEFSPITWLAKNFQATLNIPSSQRSEALAAIWLIVLSLLAIITALVWCYISNLWLSIKDRFIADGPGISTSKIALMWEVLKDSPLDRMLMCSLLNTRHVMLTLDSGKIYVGIINNLGEPTETEGPDQEISLVPILSGYRDTVTKKAIFNNFYESVDDDPGELGLVIPQSQIVTASWFDFDTYERLSENQSPEEGEINLLL